MKSVFYILIILLSGISCKKNYTCECSTPNIQGIGTKQPPFTNFQTYNVKEKNKSDAMVNCSRQYEASGKATGGINCEVK